MKHNSYCKLCHTTESCALQVQTKKANPFKLSVFNSTNPDATQLLFFKMLSEFTQRDFVISTLQSIFLESG